MEVILKSILAVFQLIRPASTRIYPIKVLDLDWLSSGDKFGRYKSSHSCLLLGVTGSFRHKLKRTHHLHDHIHVLGDVLIQKTVGDFVSAQPLAIFIPLLLKQQFFLRIYLYSKRVPIQGLLKVPGLYFLRLCNRGRPFD
jgi:hypothetical protein